jgi:hypothetical protein
MEGSDEKMSWLIFSSRHSVLGDAIARAAIGGPLRDLQFIRLILFILSDVFVMGLARFQKLILEICVYLRP